VSGKLTTLTKPQSKPRLPVATYRGKSSRFSQLKPLQSSQPPSNPFIFGNQTVIALVFAKVNQQKVAHTTTLTFTK